METIKPGDLFQTSWGYDQTNYDFIVIEEVSKTGKTVKARRARPKEVGHTGQCHIQKPTREAFGDQFRLSVREYDGCNGDTIILRGSYPFDDDGDMNVKRAGSFFRVREGMTYYETDTRFGH